MCSGTVIFNFFSYYFHKVEQTQLNSVIDSDLIDIQKFLPFKSVDKILAFCSDEDGLLAKRKHALLKKIKAVSDTSSWRNFVGSVTNALFDKKFVIAHKWPVKEYVSINNVFIYILLLLIIFLPAVGNGTYPKSITAISQLFRAFLLQCWISPSRNLPVLILSKKDTVAKLSSVKFESSFRMPHQKRY